MSSAPIKNIIVFSATGERGLTFPSFHVLLSPARSPGVIVFILPNERGQVAVTLVVACMFALVFEALAPYDGRWDAWMSRSGHVIVLLSVFVAFLLEQEKDSEETSSSHDLYGGVLLAFNVCMVLAVVVQGVTMACSVTRPAEALPRSVSLAAVGFHVQENGGRGTTDRAKTSFGTKEAEEDDQDSDIAFEKKRRIRTFTTVKIKKRRAFRTAAADFGGGVSRTSPRDRQAKIAPANSDDDSEDGKNLAW